VKRKCSATDRFGPCPIPGTKYKKGKWWCRYCFEPLRASTSRLVEERGRIMEGMIKQTLDQNAND